MKIAIAGLGYVGAVTAGCLARLGHEVLGCDTDVVKVGAIGAGRSPIAEPGLDDLLAEAVASGRLTTADLPTAVRWADVIMVAVGTPSAASGALGLDAVRRVCDEIGAALAADDGRHRTVVIRSTVLPGTIHDVVIPALEQGCGRRAGTSFGVATNPEFLREGTSIRDFFEASRTIVGADDDGSADVLRELYRDLPAPILVVPIRTAELAKYADNAFHAVKIAFANEMASFARRFDIDGRDVMRLVASDDRLNISTAYLRPGYAFGGSCLPKDLRAITDRARKSDVSMPLLEAALASNRAHFERGVQLVEEAGGRAVALLGLSFKPSTDDLRESPAVALAERLLGRGYAVTIYDEDVQPEQIRGANRSFIDEHLPHVGRLLAASVDESMRDADTVVVTKASSAAGVPQLLTDHQTVVDLVGVPWAADLPPDRYRGIGW
jgi:GDP-mannose 6-dehydrogenase